ncbi:MAG: D-glycero-beta-D-manno-heptose-7-phosphate kinase [Candidatus Edwardsbacteria bacterium]|nr:D-glycero-beta-D-manno-heptose-7-phosphate kinase [Candidatus Edwardsbacteria bacterium]MBU1577436.1 D-glycero-beta-D-manno-heptose-7-phosphate kinase [Candidatus Edwardsbacteria bacterium]MBU2463230.1 D-glycero-beta-D-manno-heptose-7-phosphate kinase [Candidatus Edwardsbacteria bacterium]MBU2593003.1 D-glycero-beta-D-manno-heptose-7-phosphate kinase [Candidatus Edwardsbacteria bacterium]
MQYKIDKKRSDILINSFRQKTILVLGDLMLDEYLFGQVSRISPEAPVPVVEVSEEKYLLGGAANVAWNIASLGAKVVPVGVVGRDRPRQTILKEFQKRKISKNGLVEDPQRHTTIKTRIVAHHQQVVRVDREHRQDLSPASEAKVIARLKKLIPAADAVLIEDYNKGLITDRVLKAALDLCRKHKKIVTVDPKFNHFLDFHGVTLFKPNVLETERALGMKIAGPQDMLKAGKMLMAKLKTKAVLITAGDRGMYLITSENKSEHIPTMAREVYDVSGAGDTVIAVLTLALAAGASFLEAAVLANHAAGVEVSKFGVAAVSVNELKEALESW